MAGRASLRDYYGLDKPGDTPPAKVPVAEMATTLPLDALLKKSIDLMDGIRELKADRQSLVYNHHQELVAASETVGKMRAGLEELHTQREELQGQLQAIDAHRETIARHAAEPDAIDWHGAVAPVTELPAKLERLKQHNATEALDAYEKHKETLAAWVDAGVDGAQDVQRACEAALQS